ncbi:MAG: S-layer homology domain-containing protein [Oscillospiraceae bacterium]|nr:S-layer homology domain-containing protein [Oscillospiraceae bacterium]
MKKGIKRALSLILSVALALSLCCGAFALDKSKLDNYVSVSSKLMYETVKNPQVGSIGGEWAVIGLARSGYKVPDDYFKAYYETLEAYVKSCKGILHSKKYTEYSRTALAVTAIGKDPRDVGGYNLLTPLGDFEKTIWQGINGPIWALIALDSGNYEIPRNPEAATQATRQMYVDEIISRQLDDGGWNLTDKGGSGSADADITGMALQALAKYLSSAKVKTACDRALDCLSRMQDNSGGFASWGTTNSESSVQVLVALCEMGISLDDERFVKNGKTVLDNVLSFRNSDGSFKHTSDGSGNNQMSFEQGLYGIVAAQRAMEGKNSLYRMSDATSAGWQDDGGSKKGEGLEGKHEDVKPMKITAPGLTFDDIFDSENRAAIEALASRGIINGKGEGLFDPEAEMTRAEFATIITRGLGLVPEDTGVFSDVAPDKWYAAYIGTANKYGIVNGVGGGRFNPEGTITRQEAATMVARAAKLCGMNTEMSTGEIRDVLAQFGDYVTIASWAQGTMAFCYANGILDQNDIDTRPSVPILRCEIAQMLFNMLSEANLL